MSQQVAVNEVVQVEARMGPAGGVVVKAFDWRGRRHHVASHGRRWEERRDGRLIRCFLVQTAELNSFELRWDPVGDDWTLHQAWLVNHV